MNITKKTEAVEFECNYTLEIIVQRTNVKIVKTGEKCGRSTSDLTAFIWVYRAEMVNLDFIVFTHSAAMVTFTYCQQAIHLNKHSKPNHVYSGTVQHSPLPLRVCAYVRYDCKPTTTTWKKTHTAFHRFFPPIIMDSISLFNIRYDRFVYKFIFWQQLQKS